MQRNGTIYTEERILLKYIKKLDQMQIWKWLCWTIKIIISFKHDDNAAKSFDISAISLNVQYNYLD